MKPHLLDLLACPACLASLTLRDAVHAEGEVREGTLACAGCKAAYPVQGFIPRFVEGDRFTDSFSFEWRVFREVQIDILNKTNISEETFAAKTGYAAADAPGRLFLDAGVGAGRYAEVVSRWGGEVVGLDLSFAVDAAFTTIGLRPKVHLVQADIFRPPFRPATFDHAYSIGVLHHTPDTRGSFASLAPLVKAGGGFAVYLYPTGPYSVFSDLWRKATVHLPLRVAYALAALAVPLYFVYRLPLLGHALRLLFPISLEPRWRWRWLDTFDWYTPKYQWKHTYPEVFRWYRENGYGEVELHEHPVCMRGFKRP